LETNAVFKEIDPGCAVAGSIGEKRVSHPYKVCRVVQIQVVDLPWHLWRASAVEIIANLCHEEHQLEINGVDSCRT